MTRHPRGRDPPIGLTTYDAKDPDTSYPPIEPLRPPEGAPNFERSPRRASSTTASTRPRCARRPAPRCSPVATTTPSASKIDEFGGPEAYNHYAVGWAHAMDTPYQWTKQVASHSGGTRNGTIIRWPAGFENSVLMMKNTSFSLTADRRPGRR